MTRPVSEADAVVVALLEVRGVSRVLRARSRLLVWVLAGVTVVSVVAGLFL